MISATIGIPGAGKSFWAVKTMLDYMASGGVVFSNIKLTGLVDSGEAGFFRWRLAADSPAVKYLKKNLRWDYRQGVNDEGQFFAQYSYIPLDEYDENFLKLIAHGSPSKPVLLLLDEVNLWFDSLDRGKLSNDSKYRELFDFLRLSRHHHIDVNFLLQDFNTLNSRLRGLCAKIIKSQDLQSMKIKGIPIPFPFKWFLWQEFDSKGKTVVRSQTWFKDPEIFACYDSFCAVGESALSGISICSDFTESKKKGKGKKMSVFERVVLYASLIALGWFGFSLRAEFRRVHGVASAPVPAVSTNEIKQLFPSVLPASVPARPAAPKGRAVSFGTGEFKYAEFQGEPYLFIDGVRIIKGRLYKEGVCINLGSDFAMFSGAGGDTWIYKQEYESPRDVEAVALKDPPHVAHD
jgi:hypothetical protein